MDDRTGYDWRISSYSGGGNCVEVEVTGDEVRMRHSADRSGPVLTVGRDTFQALLDDVKAGGLDLPAAGLSD